MPKISIVLGTYNQKDNLKLVLDSFNRQTCSPEEFEVIVVDSSSTDGTDRMVKEFKPSYQLNYQRVENKGKAVARNLGIKLAKSGLILITDADMVAHPDLVKEHLAFHLSHSNAIAEGLTLAPVTLLPYIRENFKAGKRLKFSYFLTGNLSIGKETILKAGLFDEDFKGYGWEDIELGYRLTVKMRVPLYYLPSAVNYHYHFAAEVDMLKRKFEMGRSAQIFLKKHPEPAVCLFLGINPVATAIFHFIRSRPGVLRYIENKAKRSGIFEYLLEEYWYREGLWS